MNQLLAYVQSGTFAQFLTTTGIPLILTTILVSFVALLVEIRLPLRYYWDLPGHAIISLLRGVRLIQPVKPWGRCFNQDDEKPLPLVACELLDETTHRVLMRTYSNHLGEYGFKLNPGRYLLRATKNRYRLPSFLDPENVEVVEVDQSFVVTVVVLNRDVVPTVDLPMVPVKRMPELSAAQAFWHYVRMFLFQLGNAFLFLDVLVALLGFAVTHDPFYGLVLAVAIVLLFVKLYILETISVLTRTGHA